MVDRSNEQWIAALSQPGPEYDVALEDLRAILVRGLGYALSEVIEAAGLKLPLFVPCLIMGIVIANLRAALRPNAPPVSRTPSLALISEFALGAFLANVVDSIQKSKYDQAISSLQHASSSFAHKPLGIGVAAGDDCLGVVGAVSADMRHGRLHIRHHFDRQDQIEVFRRPVRFRGRIGVGQDAAGTGTSPEFHARCFESVTHPG